MSNKTKLIIFAVGIALAISAGIMLSMNDFSSAKEENEKIVKKEKKQKEKIEKQKPVLELTQDVVELEIGSTFFFQDFIAKAEDENGFNLKDKVKVSKTISTEYAGEYQVDYELKVESGKKIVKQLKLKVIDFETSVNPD